MWKFQIGFVSGYLERLTANSTSQPFNRRKWNDLQFPSGAILKVILRQSHLFALSQKSVFH